ncbi:hypothetical protein [Cellvibrio sp. PSBB006]|uniref:hypothetical protein n=1 Tax=Cellvibrio sp. PSBB006 TaxID=1987723 RepID=UPI000B3B5DCC|nr:hypothetical protein [Cellvibrio sp. PSBB006]ARU28746.1 hypothetical protein CBR65_15575 [Cellvibrio sp. PSBB006]
MDTSQDIHTQLLLKHGAVQTSPQHAAMLNSQTNKKFISTIDKTQNPAGYKVTLTGYAGFILARESKTSDYQSLDDLLRQLRAIPRSTSASILKGSISTFKLENNAYRVDYRIASGEVLVYNIQLIDKLQKQRDRLEQASLYHVKRNGQGVWQIKTKIDKVSTTYAAVNGQSNNLTKATWLMGAHLEYEFKNLQEYTLFHNPSVGGIGDTWESFRDKMGITTAVTRHFAKVLADTQAQDNKTQWIAHSQGGVIFAEAVRYLLNGSSSWMFNKWRLNGLRAQDKGKLLDKHSIVFHGNANNNLRSKPLFSRAGVKVLAIRSNDYDMVPNIIGMNTLNPRKILGSVLYSNHVMSGSVSQSPHTLMQSQESWRHNMDNGPGKGRNGIQKVFNKIETSINKKSTPNYLP